MSLTAETQVDILVEEVVEGMPLICPISHNILEFRDHGSPPHHQPRSGRFDDHTLLTRCIQPSLLATISREVSDIVGIARSVLVHPITLFARFASNRAKSVIPLWC